MCAAKSRSARVTIDCAATHDRRVVRQPNRREVIAGAIAAGVTMASGDALAAPAIVQAQGDWPKAHSRDRSPSRGLGLSHCFDL